ncbi:MAG TPA: DUF1508 domain-containing protein [Phycisphaerae bacterium]|nr:DUF1508 domain-containing protein [Phycisphaerae bacterium]
MKYEVWRNAKGEWRWRARARNGKIVATAGESFRGRSGAMKGILVLTKTDKDTVVEIAGEEQPITVAQIAPTGSVRKVV